MNGRSSGGATAAYGVTSGVEGAGSSEEQAMRRLAMDHMVVAGGTSRRAPTRRLRRIRGVLDRVWSDLSMHPKEGRAAEWLLDNAFVIAEASDLLRLVLSRGFVRSLPRLAAGPRAGERRVHDLARALFLVQGGPPDVERLTRLIGVYQERVLLSIGELWALPALLRLVALEELATEAARLVGLTADDFKSLLPEADPSVRIGELVEALRALATHDWKRFVESVSRVDMVLREDPAGAYARMDFDTRDRYRKAVEELALRSPRTELEVAQAAVTLAVGRGPADVAGHHVGYFLVDRGRSELEQQVAWRVPLHRRFARAVRPARLILYLGAIAGLTAVLAFVLSLPAGGGGIAAFVLALLLSIVPASAVATGIVNWIATRWIRPRPLPKLEGDAETTSLFPTLVVVPALLADEAEVEQLLRQLEQHYHGCSGLDLDFVLLTDYTDAPAAAMPEDAAVLRGAEDGIRALNLRHGAGPDVGPFLLVHRERRWNPAEQSWMGWERKRGKLSQLNRTVLGSLDELDVRAGDPARLRGKRFIITLDADTVLPPGAAASLIGTAAHPLNRPGFDEHGHVTRGYTVFQPRIEVLLPHAGASLFARVFEGDRGLDLYSRAVSDAYQDLFGEGSYAGKGLYDVAAFERSLAGSVADNALLSHDLFEGEHGRAALVSDVAVFEEYPGHVLVHVQRLHRWIRGDWQIAPWLLPRVPAAAGSQRNRLSPLARWKIADNLRRSLVEPAVLVLLLAGWLLLPPPVWWWTLGAVAVPGLAFLLGTLGAARGRVRVPRQWLTLPAAATAFYTELGRWGLLLVLLPYHARVALDAIARTLWRLLVSRRNLLQWSSAASVGRALSDTGPALLWRRMSFAPAFALAAAAALLLMRPAALAVAAPLLAAWFLSPWVAFVVSRPGRAAPPLTDADLLAVRRLARRTWAFFESVLGPDDHWLAPDHVQEEPHPHAARRTSPTNIGLAAAATLAAYDFGYLPASEVGALLSNTFDTLDKLERVRGHFLNWYDTHQLRTLLPRYVSTVDSGNLAGALIAIARGCESLPDQPLLRAADRAGMLDALGLVQDAIRKPGVRSTAGFRVLEQAIDEAMDALPAGGDASRDAVRTLDDFVDRVMPRLELLAADAAESAEHRLTAADLAELRTALVRARHQASTLRAELHTLQPWCTLPDEPPAGATPAPAQSMEVWREFLATLPEGVTLAKTPDVAREILAALPLLSGTLADAGADADEVARWRDAFTVRLETACDRAAGFLEELHSVTRRADTFVNEMEFGFLFDADRQLFHIGYDVESGTLDRSYYDLLASEARLASLLAIARAQVPPEHWLHLARPFARANGRPVMLSWSGTMFEYHLPLIFMRDAAPTLLSFACEAAVREQIAYAKRFGVPWGLSESAYHAVDRHGTYQYRAFGVPSLSLRREKLEHIVIAPYASVLALQRHAHDVARNLVRLAALGGEGRFGMYEAVDFGRNPIRAPSHVVKSYMAHHQAMILLAIDNALHNNVMVDRFHADLRIAAVDYLLLERLPGEVRREPSAPLLVPTRRTHQAGGTVSPWRVESGPQRPAVHVLSNGRWSTLITDRGSGNARWPGHAITRWRADPTVDEDGTWLYVQDVERGSLWSATLRPTGGRADRLEVRFGPHVAEFHRRQGDIITRLSVAVQADADVEVRRLVIANEGRTSRRLAVTTFGEVVLGSHAEDRRHPAFSRLFVESEYVEARRALVFHRRGRSGSGLWLAHALVVDGKRARIAGWDTDRATFIGRTGSPARPAGLVHGPASLARSAGCTLDPIFALSTEIGVPADGRREVVALTAVGVTQHAALEAVERLMSPGHAERAIARAQERTEGLLAELGLSGSQVVMAQALLSAIVYPYHDRRGAGDGLLQRQNALWGLGISGDQPVVVVRASTLDLRDELLDLLRAHAWLARQQVQADLVVCSAHPAGYVDPLADWLRHAVENLHGAGAWQQAGGVFHVPAGRLDPDRSAALDASAALLLELGEERIENQLARTRAVRLRLPVFVPVPSAPLSDLPTEPLPRTERLLLDNGLGGIAPDGREYVIRVRPRVPTPAPWINVIANEEFGFLVSEIGAGFTWSRDSGHRRLTPWYNDPVRNRGGEAVYLRDEETGAVWSATPAPAGADTPWEVRHGAGHTTFLHHGHGLAQRLRLFVAERDPVKFAVLELHNLWPRHRRITVTYFAEWVLGVHRDLHAPHVVTEMMPEARAILARQRFDPAHAGRIAFLSSGEHVHGATADRLEFLGSGGPARPAALSRIGLGEAFGHGLDPCAALQIHVDLAPGERRSVHYLLGDAASREEVFELAARYRSPDAVEAAFQGAHAAWERTLDRVEVSTPDAAMNAMLNRWLPYQALTSRLWARTGFYQSSGAYGFRDQLQDALAFLATRPEITRERIAEAARHQFIEGDVLHWWHPHTNTGVRTRCSDDLLWLPFATAAFVDATGDRTILDEPIPFLNAPPLRDGEHERYDHYDTAGGTSTLHDHCLRALDRSRGRGAHGLPLMGAGDWNDGLDRVGAGGKGESVWLGWFLHTVLEAFARICDTTDAQRAGALRTDAARLQEALERSAWDGDWYRRAYYDDGSPLGTATDAEARIDSISQSWAVLSRAATPERARKAMDAVRRLLLDEENRLLKLLTPAFDRTERDPGYIRAYPPGVRENGGQYTHAAVWAAWAFCALGEGRPGYDLFCMLNPLLRSTTPEETARYRVEPWVVAADIYSVPPLLGRGGWTWYTGSAGWLYRFGVEAVLGLRLRGGHLYVEPAIPAAWPEYTMVYRAGDAEYRIRVENPAGEYEGVEEVRLDGRTLPDLAVPIAANGCHEVVVRLGTKTASRPWSPVLW